MGDAGSNLIGFLLAAVGVAGGWYQDERSIVVSLSVPVLILSVLIFDMVMTSILRFVEGKVKNIPELLAYAGRDHIHHRIQKSGFSTVRTVLIIYLISATTGLLALYIRTVGEFWRYSILTVVVLITVLGIVNMYKIEKNFK
jgi:UDP-GlcNAc:undecaprenyl-phosphate GlcNAc-1-phosphate transferase